MVLWRSSCINAYLHIVNSKGFLIFNVCSNVFLREHIEDLLRNIRTQVLIKLIKPYTRIHIPFIAKELNIDVADVESLLVACILDDQIHGRIDQVTQVGFVLVG